MDSKEIYIDPIFYDLLDNFRFFLVGINMMSIPDFQRVLITRHSNEKNVLDISVKHDSINYLLFDTKDILSKFNRVVDLKVEEGKVRVNIKKLINSQARQISISLADILEDSNFASLKSTDIFRFVECIRNGAAHKNKFHFNDETRQNLPVSWRDKKIELSLHGDEVFEKFLAPADLILLISDISELIKK